jgi:carnitine O-acetyltransferase
MRPAAAILSRRTLLSLSSSASASSSTSALLSPQFTSAAVRFNQCGSTTSTRMSHSLKPSGPNKPMYQYQANLPKLPVPSLAETAEKYLKTVRPHYNDADYAKTEAAVRAFVAPGGLGQELQKRLEQRRDTESTSWLLEWWNDLSYMGE